MLSVTFVADGRNGYRYISAHCPNENQVDAMRNFSEEDGVAHFINSSLTKSAIEQVKSDILAGKTKLLYVAPESLTKEENVDFLKHVKISFMQSTKHIVSLNGDTISVRNTVVSVLSSMKSVKHRSLP